MPSGALAYERVNWVFPSGLPIDVAHVQQRDLSLHVHSFSELVIVLSGSGAHITAEHEYPISAGDVFVLHGDQAHGYRDSKGLEIVNILFRMEQLGIPLFDATSMAGYHALFQLEPLYRQRHGFESRLRLSATGLERITVLVNRLQQEVHTSAPGHIAGAVAAFMLILVDLCRSYGRSNNVNVQPLLRLGRVIGHMQHYYADSMSLDDLAEIGNMSRRSLTREFRSATGQSPIEYLNSLRIARATELLLTTRDTITSIAFAVGFKDSNYFARAFRKAQGCSPREFRMRRRS